MLGIVPSKNHARNRQECGLLSMLREHDGTSREPDMNNGIKETMQGLATELGIESPLVEEQVIAASPSREFGISVASGRIYVQNAAGKVIEVGDMVEQQGIYSYRLDAGAIQGQQFGNLDSALRHLASQLTYLYLDQLFKQLPDSAAEAGAHSISRPALRIELA
jgi:hypothetical protein